MQALLTILSPAEASPPLSFGQVSDSTKLFPFPSPGCLHEAIPLESGDETKASAFLAGIARAISPPGGMLLWVAEEAFGAEHGELYSPGLASFGFDPGDVILVRARRRVDALWAAEQGLKRRGTIVLLELGARGKALDLTVTRRLALAARSKGSTALLVRGDLTGMPRTPSAAWTRWQIARTNARQSHAGELSALAMTALLARHRERPAGQRFFLEWMCDEHAFHIEALGSDLAASAGDRPHQTSREESLAGPCDLQPRGLGLSHQRG
jgi:protein ImuA